MSGRGPAAPCRLCGDRCLCVDDCHCTETFCRGEASSILNSLSNTPRSSATIESLTAIATTTPSSSLAVQASSPVDENSTTVNPSTPGPLHATPPRITPESTSRQHQEDPSMDQGSELSDRVAAPAISAATTPDPFTPLPVFDLELQVKNGNDEHDEDEVFVSAAGSPSTSTYVLDNDLTDARDSSVVDAGLNAHDLEEGRIRDDVPTTTPFQYKANILIGGMTCTICSQTIQSALEKLPGVLSVQISVTTDSGIVEWRQDSSTNLDTITETIESIGYDVEDARMIVTNVVTSRSRTNSGDLPLGLISTNSDNEIEQTHSTTNTTAQIEPSSQERWERLRDRQRRKVSARRNAFLWSLIGTIPILLLTMILPIAFIPSFLSRTVHILHRPFQVEALVLWILASPVQFLSGWEFYRGAFMGLRSGRAGMDVLVALGTSASYGYALVAGALSNDTHTAHFFETSAVLISFILLGKFMQAMAVRRTSEALSQLMQLQCKTAVKVTAFKDRQNFNPSKDPYKEVTVPVEAIHKGDMVKVIRGASVPADGRILFGEVEVDESMVTGESFPVLKTPGSIVLGGTVCIEAGDGGAAFVEVTGVGSETALAQIVNLVQEAQMRSVPIQSLADQISGVFVPSVCAVSVATFLVWYGLCRFGWIPSSWYKDQGEDPMTFSIKFAIACLVISCPCALGLATPTAVMVGTGVSARQGVLIKGGEALEVASKIDAVVFDKTGTLTKGRPIVSDVIYLEQWSEHEKVNMLWLLACLERSSEHPLARAIVEYVEDHLDDECLMCNPMQHPTHFRAFTGRGVVGTVGSNMVAVGNRSFASVVELAIPMVAEECMISIEQEGKTAVVVAIDTKICAVLGVADELKGDATDAIAYLRNVLKVEVWMVTGDNCRTAQAIAAQLGLPSNRVISEALPAAKLDQVKSLQEQGHVVAMVGDGVNDSPALAQADVGIAFATGAEIAAEAADVVSVKGHVRDVCVALNLSRVIFRRIQWNFVWSLFYNVLGIPIAAGVFYPVFHTRLPPTFAALAMALSSISVVVSSLALRLYRPPSIDVASRRRLRRRSTTTWERTMLSRQPSGVGSDNDLTEHLLAPDHMEGGSEFTEETTPVDNRTFRHGRRGRR